MNVRDEPVAAFRHRFNEAGVVRIVPERQANLLDAVIEPLLEVDDGSGPPDLVAQLLARHEPPRLRRERRQELEWLWRPADQGPAFARSEERRVGKEGRSRWSPYH